MLDQAQKMRANWQTGNSGGGQNDRLYTKKQTDKELQAFVQRMVENAVNQQEKKRNAGTVHLERSTSQLRCRRRMMTTIAMTRTSLISSKVSASTEPMTTNSRVVMVLIIEVQAESPLVKNVTVTIRRLMLTYL